MSKVVYGSETVGNHPLLDQDAHIDYDRPQIIAMSRNPSVTFHKVWYRGHPVPYVEVFKYPVGDDGQQVYPISDGSDGPMTVYPHDGTYKYELTLDGRWANDFDSIEEIERIMPLLADGMAVAAGYACHGSTNRLNAHGPTSHHQDTSAGEIVID